MALKEATAEFVFKLWKTFKAKCKNNFKSFSQCHEDFYLWNLKIKIGERFWFNLTIDNILWKK